MKNYMQSVTEMIAETTEENMVFVIFLSDRCGKVYYEYFPHTGILIQSHYRPLYKKGCISICVCK